jgi:hypothetical protein
MDQFGIGTAIEGCAVNYFAVSRQTGRTTQMIESLQDGDRVVCLSDEKAAWLRRRLKEFEKDINVICVPTKEPRLIFEHKTSKGRTVFDHEWIEKYYAEVIQGAQKNIDLFQRESSGFGAAHIENRMMLKNRGKFCGSRF